MNVSTFDGARKAVAAGSRPDEVARSLVATLTPEERLWCLDGDAPIWAGLKFLAGGGYHEAPFVAAEVERVGIPGIRFSDGPRGAVVGNATCFPVSMARGAATGVHRFVIARNATDPGAVTVEIDRTPVLP